MCQREWTTAADGLTQSAIDPWAAYPARLAALIDEKKRTAKPLNPDQYASNGDFLPLSIWKGKGYDADIIHNFSRPCDVKEDPTNVKGPMLYRVRVKAFRVRKKMVDPEFQAKRAATVEGQQQEEDPEFQAKRAAAVEGQQQEEEGAPSDGQRGERDVQQEEEVASNEGSFGSSDERSNQL